MTATGIHEHPTMKTGKRPPKKHAALNFADLITTVPVHPVVEGVAASFVAAMNLNDRIGDCVVANTDNCLQAIYTAYGVDRSHWSDDQIVAYYKTQNPDFDLNGSPSTDGPESQADGGMDIQTFLEYLQKQGVIIAFASIDHTNIELLKAAVFIGGAIVTGQVLQKAQQTQKTWSYVKGSPEWGGHCTTDVAYGTDVQTDTWTQLVQVDPSFLQHCRDEAWFVLVQPHLDHPQTRAQLDLEGWAAAFKAMTGRDFPVPLPAPAPAPDPVVPSAGDADHALAAAAAPWVKQHHSGTNATMQRALQTWLEAKGYPA